MIILIEHVMIIMYLPRSLLSRVFFFFLLSSSWKNWKGVSSTYYVFFSLCKKIDLDELTTIKYLFTKKWLKNIWWDVWRDFVCGENLDMAKFFIFCESKEKIEILKFHFNLRFFFLSSKRKKSFRVSDKFNKRSAAEQEWMRKKRASVVFHYDWITISSWSPSFSKWIINPSVRITELPDGWRLSSPFTWRRK